MSDVKGDIKTYSFEKPQLKFNIMDLSPAEIESQIDYIMHVEHELPMEWYTRLDALKKDLVEMVIVIADHGVNRYQQEYIANVTDHFKESLRSITYGAKVKMHKKVIVSTTIDDEKVIGTEVKDTGELYDW